MLGGGHVSHFPNPNPRDKDYDYDDENTLPTRTKIGDRPQNFDESVGCGNEGLAADAVKGFADFVGEAVDEPKHEGLGREGVILNQRRHIDGIGDRFSVIDGIRVAVGRVGALASQCGEVVALAARDL